MLVAAGLILESPLLAVNDVDVTGAVYTDPARLAEVVDDLDGSSLLGADLGKAEATLAADPWVKRVRVERRLLRGVRIEIVERIPVTTYMGEDQRWRVLDAEGKVMAVLDPPGSKPVDPLELTLATPGPDLEPGATAPGRHSPVPPASCRGCPPTSGAGPVRSPSASREGCNSTCATGSSSTSARPIGCATSSSPPSSSSTPGPTKWPPRADSTSAIRNVRS